MALTFARHLAKDYGAKLILSGRTEIPPMQEWKKWSNHPATTDKQRKRYLSLLEIAGSATSLEYVKMDVADAGEVSATVMSLREKHGRIDGVIHTAGVAGGKLVQLQNENVFLKTISPKVSGARNLIEFLRDEPPDFLALCSSMSAMLGGFGQSDYSTANAWMDAIAIAAWDRGDRWVKTLNWDRWSGVGMAVETGISTRLESAKKNEEKFAIKPDEGFLALKLALPIHLPQVLITTRPLAFYRQIGQARESETNLAPKRTMQPRPRLASECVAPSSETQKAMAGIWQNILGIEGIGIDDNFFELGGDSLLALSVTSLSRDCVIGDFPITLLFSHPTIRGLCGAIDGK